MRSRDGTWCPRSAPICQDLACWSSSTASRWPSSKRRKPPTIRGAPAPPRWNGRCRRRRRSTSSKCCQRCSENRRPREGGDPVNTGFALLRRVQRLLGRPVKPGDDNREDESAPLSIVEHHFDLAAPRISEAGVADYIALLKPRVM